MKENTHDKGMPLGTERVRVKVELKGRGVGVVGLEKGSVEMTMGMGWGDRGTLYAMSSD